MGHGKRTVRRDAACFYKDVGAVQNTLFNCRGRGFEICFLIYVPGLNSTVEDEEDENS